MESDLKKRHDGKKKKKMGPELIKSAVLGLVFFFYLMAGAMIFQMLEQKAESNVKEKTERHRLDFLKNFTCLTHDALEHLIHVVAEAAKQGLNPLEDSTTGKHTNWDFGSAFFFAGTVVTTIGYGTIAPRTTSGQMFCVIFALIGIPFNIIVLNRVGKMFSHWCKPFAKRLVKNGMNKKIAKVMTIIFFLLLGIIIFLGIPPMIFRDTECWTYAEGVYYAFISLTTIGFGDYVVGSGQRCTHPFEGYRALVYFWIIFGLAWLSLLINLLTSFFKKTEKKIVEDIRKKVKHRKEKSHGTALEVLTQKCEAQQESSVI